MNAIMTSELRPADGTACLWPSDSIELAAVPGAVPAARARIRAILCEWDAGELAGDAEQVAAELIANAVGATRKAGLDTPVRLTLIAGPRTLLITVWDGCADLPVRRDPGPAAESGRGLVIVGALADWWDTRPAPAGKVVRALIRGNARRDL